MDPSYSSSSTTSASTPALNTRSHARPSTNTPSSAAYEGRSSDSSSSSSRSSRRSMATEKRIHRYLTLYNLVSLLLWTAVLGRLVLLVPLVGVRGVYGGVGEWAKWTQTGMLLEVGHAAFGFVRAPILTTLIQVASRILLVWGICNPAVFQPLTTTSPFYASMLTAWSATEIIRYAYFFTALQRSGPGPASKGSPPPAWLTYLRYSTFYVLYPIGITSEWLLIYRASTIAAGVHGRRQSEGLAGVKWALWAVLAVYVPGSWIMFRHMMVQRKKTLARGVEDKRGKLG